MPNLHCWLLLLRTGGGRKLSPAIAEGTLKRPGEITLLDRCQNEQKKGKIRQMMFVA
jgi:hypothetical protein